MTAAPLDLSDAVALSKAYEQADGVFIHLPMAAPQETRRQVRALVAAIAEAQPTRVVISTSGQPVDYFNREYSGHSEIDSSILGVIETGVSTAVVAPNLYLENLLLPVVAGPAVEEGVLRYPLREDLRVSWSSHLDVAEVAVRLLTDTGVTGVVAVGHHPGLTGPDLASEFSLHLGRPVRFESITPGGFGEMIAPVFGAAAAAPVVSLYSSLNAQTDHTIDPSSSAQELLGLEPRRVSEWLKDVGL